MRHFIRHPVDIPIEIDIAHNHCWQGSQLQNLSYGGLCCQVSDSIPIGAAIRLRIPVLQPDYEGFGMVVWCRPEGLHFDIGVQFVDEQEAFKSRMVEQVCQIERYRQTVCVYEGRDLSKEQAAVEWISKYAADFALHLDS